MTHVDRVRKFLNEYRFLYDERPEWWERDGMRLLVEMQAAAVAEVRSTVGAPSDSPPEPEVPVAPTFTRAEILRIKGCGDKVAGFFVAWLKEKGLREVRL